MAAKMGKDGFISIAGTTERPAYIDNWTLNAEIGTVEVTAFGESARSYVSTLRGWSVTCGGTLDKSDTDQDAVLDLIAATSSPSAVSLRLYDSSSYWSGSGYLTSVSINSQVGDKVALTFNFLGSSNLSRTGDG